MKLREADTGYQPPFFGQVVKEGMQCQVRHDGETNHGIVKGFVSEVEEFLASQGGCPRWVHVVPVPLSYFASCHEAASIDCAAGALLEMRRRDIAAGLKETIFIYEDLWRSRQELVRRRLRSHIGRGGRIYARNCDVREISSPCAASFLEKHHLYGSTGSPYRYGLFRRRATGAAEAGMPDTDTLVAVGTFSIRNEWERYASLPQYRVCGGMGRILKRFIWDTHPREVMSYADMEWGDGGVYAQLGFRVERLTPPVHFRIEPGTCRRVHLCKIGRDRKFRDTGGLNWTEIANPGSLLMLLDVEKLGESCHVEDLPDGRLHVFDGETSSGAFDALEQGEHHTES